MNPKRLRQSVDSNHHRLDASSRVSRQRPGQPSTAGPAHSERPLVVMFVGTFGSCELHLLDEVTGQRGESHSGSEIILPTPPLPGSRPKPFQNDRHVDLFGNLRARRHRGDSSAIEDVTVVLVGSVLPYVREIPVGVPRGGVGTACFAVDADPAQPAANRHTGRRCASRDGSTLRRYRCSVSMFLWPVTSSAMSCKGMCAIHAPVAPPTRKLRPVIRAAGSSPCLADMA